MRSRSASHREPLAAAFTFALTAALVSVIVWASGEQLADWELYRSYGEAMESGLVPYRDFAVEYPPGALPAFVLPALLTSTEDQYYSVFAALMGVCGAFGVYVTGLSLRRLHRSRRVTRRVLWLLALSPVLFGGVLLSRFDLLPAALVAAATTLALYARPRAAAALLGAAIAVKAYPVVLLPVLTVWAWRRHGRRAGLAVPAVAAAVVALAVLPFVILSPGGVVDAVDGQLGRPLQIETIGAGLVVLVHGLAGATVDVVGSHGSDNLTGPGAAAIATTASFLQLAVLCALWWRYARGPTTAERSVRYAAATLVAVVALGKVLSPQFLVWCLFAIPLVAGRTGVAAGALFGVAALATAIWYPAQYTTYVREQDPALALLVVLRGAALLAALVVLAWPRREPFTARAPAATRSRLPSPSAGRR
jgi:hypothetical protein